MNFLCDVVMRVIYAFENPFNGGPINGFIIGVTISAIYYCLKLYFYPSILAFRARNAAFVSIWRWNFFTGWTVFGWVFLYARARSNIETRSVNGIEVDNSQDN